MRPSVKVSRSVFGALIAVALGFGAGQATAAPATAEGAYCTRQDQSFCISYCYDTYGDGYRARCTRDAFGFVDCECYTV